MYCIFEEMRVDCLWKLVTVTFIYSQVVLTCTVFLKKLESTVYGRQINYFVIRLRNCYSISNKDITNTVMQLGRGCRIYLFIALQ